MNGNYVITIGREFGSGGREIGRILAEKLNIKCYDKELLALSAKESGLSEELFKFNDENLLTVSCIHLLWTHIRWDIQVHHIWMYL